MADPQNWWEQDTPVQPVARTGGPVPIVAAPVDPNKASQEARAEVSTDISVSDEARKGRKEQFDNAKDLRNEFRKAPEAVNYETVVRQFSSALGAQPTPTGDQALITAYAKMLDPGSVVREQEFNTVAAGDSKLGSIVARLQKEFGVDESGLIRPEVRNRVLQEMKNLADNYRSSYDRIRTDYEGLAGSYGIEPNLVLGSRIDEPYNAKIEETWKTRFPNGADATPLTISSGERFSTEADLAIAQAVNQAFAQGAGVQQLAEVAQAAGAQVTPADLAAFQQAVEARDKGQGVTFNPQQTGQRNPLEQAAGEALMTPAGTALVGGVNAAGLGLLSQFAGDQVQGLEALNPGSALTGEIIGSALGTGALAKGAGMGLKAVAPSMAERLAGGGAAGALGRAAATDAAYGGIYAANTGEDIGTGVALGAAGSLLGAGAGALASKAMPAIGRALGREAPVSAGALPEGAPPMPGAGAVPEPGAPAATPDEVPFVPQTMRSGDMGSAGTSLETQRITQAEGLPVPVELTRGAATRDPEQLAFEKEQIFGALGGPLRNRAEENNLQALGNFERMIDMTGAEAPTIATAGNPVIKALGAGYDAMKNKVNVAYKRAEDSEGAQELVPYAKLKAYIDEQDPTTRDELAPVLKSVAQQLAKNDPEGTGQITVKAMESIRKQINKKTQPKTPGEVYGGEMKGIIDKLTEGKGGELYAKARKLRIEQARKFENRAVVARLITNVKNMDDPKVASDEVFRKSILNESPDDIKFLRRTMRTLGPQGRQAWKELEGATIRHIQEAAIKGARMSAENKPIIAAGQLKSAVDALDADGRLDVIFHPRTAQQLRDLRDVVMYVNTVPPGTSINNSGTARTIMAMLGEMGVTGGASYYLTGSSVPVPIVTGLKLMMKAAKNKEIEKKIARSLLPRGTE